MKNKEFFKKIATEVAEKIKGIIAEKSFQDTLPAHDEELAKRNGVFRFKITSEELDRYGDIIDFGAIETAFWQKNPVVLWNHDASMLPIGRGTRLEFVEEEKAVYMEGIFANNDFAQTVRKEYQDGFIFACSIGYIENERFTDDEGNRRVTKAELLEVSIVPIPAHRDALTAILEKGFDLVDLVKKGFIIKKKAYPCDENKENEQDIKEKKTEPQETPDELSEANKIKAFLSEFPTEKLKDMFDTIHGIKKTLDEIKGEEVSEEANQDNNTQRVDNTEYEEEHLKNKKFMQDIAGAISEVLSDLKKTKE